jgi:hypothetical protein
MKALSTFYLKKWILIIKNKIICSAESSFWEMGLVENCHIPSMFSAYVGMNRLLTFYFGKNLGLNNHKQNNLIKKVLIPGNGASQGLSYSFDVFC